MKFAHPSEVPGKPVCFELRGKVQVLSDGVTVWVNTDEGECIGRFGKNGIDIHEKMDPTKEVGVHCLFCTHEPTNSLEDWRLFQAKMLEIYGVTVKDTHTPTRFQEMI